MDHKPSKFWGPLILALVVAVAAMGYGGRTVLSNGLDYQEMTWEEVKQLPDDLGQSTLTESSRGKYIRLTGWVNPYQTIHLITTPVDESYTLLASLDDPAYAHWLDAKRRLEQFDGLRQELARVEADESVDKDLAAKVDDLRKRMGDLQNRRKGSPDGELSPEDAQLRDNLTRELETAFDSSVVHRAAVEAEDLQSRVKELRRQLTRRPEELLSTDHVFLSYPDDGAFSKKANSGVPHALVGELDSGFDQFRKQMAFNLDGIRRQMLWIMPVSQHVKHERDRLSRALEPCNKVIQETGAVMPSGVTIEGRLRPVDSGIRGKFKDLTKHEGPRFVLEVGAPLSKAPGWGWVKFGGGALAVAAVCGLIILVRRFRERRYAPHPA